MPGSHSCRRSATAAAVSPQVWKWRAMSSASASGSWSVPAISSRIDAGTTFQRPIARVGRSSSRPADALPLDR